MSDPVKKEAEDVLTSIRRLVSTRPGGAGDVAIEKKTTGQADKLVLSSVHRVEVDPDDDPWTDTLERRIADLEAAVTSQQTEFEPDGSELLDRETPRTIDHLAAAKRMVAQIHADATEVVDSTATEIVAEAPEPLQLTTELALAKGAKAALSEADVADAAKRPEAKAEKPGGETVEPEVVETATEQDVTADAPVAQTPKTPEPPEPLATEPEVAEIDEDALRVLISAVLREEFQGDLGERITRSIRKLVRQEIKRALTANDLE